MTEPVSSGPNEVADMRLIIIVMAEHLAAMNSTLHVLDPESSGDLLTIALTTPDMPDAPLAWGCNWAMSSNTNNALKTAIRESGAWNPRLSNRERTMLTNISTVPPFGSQRCWFFDANSWSLEESLQALGLTGWAAPGGDP